MQPHVKEGQQHQPQNKRRDGGGAIGHDPKAGIGYGYVTCGMGTSLTGDPRELALRNALYSVI